MYFEIKLLLFPKTTTCMEACDNMELDMGDCKHGYRTLQDEWPLVLQEGKGSYFRYDEW